MLQKYARIVAKQSYYLHFGVVVVVKRTFTKAIAILVYLNDIVIGLKKTKTKLVSIVKKTHGH
jgi:hypothetical protein